MATTPEQLLISSLLHQRDFAVAMGAGIKTDHFTIYPDEWAFIEASYRKYKKMPSRMAFIRKFPDFVMKNVDDTGHFSEEVIQRHVRNQLTLAMSDVTNFVAANNIDAAVKLMSKSIVSIAADVGGGNDVNVLSDFDNVLEDVQARHDRAKTNGLAGLATGFPTIDKMTGGPQPGQFWVIGARLGSGKSWLMMRMAAAALMEQAKVQYNSLEMSRPEVSMRMHTLLSAGIGATVFSNLDLQQGQNIDMDQYKQFLQKLKTYMKEGGLHVTDGSRGRISPLSIQAQIERNQPDVVFIDYLTLMEGVAGGDWKTLQSLTGDLKQVSAQYQVPIIGAAQLNRSAANGKDPGGADTLAQGDSIGQDADVVLTAKKISQSALMLKCVKNRHGADEWKIYIDFRPAKGIFRECSADEAMRLKDEDDDAADRQSIAAEAAPVNARKTVRRTTSTRPVPQKRVGKSIIKAGS